MIGLTNKTRDEINILIRKYQNALEFVKYRERIPTLAFIIDIAVNYIKEKYNHLSANIKAWVIVVLENLYSNIKKESDITKIIDEFVDYYNTEYVNFTSNLVFSASDYDLESAFAHSFIDKN